jgi:hypothetical protein
MTVSTPERLRDEPAAKRVEARRQESKNKAAT